MLKSSVAIRHAPGLLGKLVSVASAVHEVVERCRNGPVAEWLLVRRRKEECLAECLAVPIGLDRNTFTFSRRSSCGISDICVFALLVANVENFDSALC